MEPHVRFHAGHGAWLGFSLSPSPAAPPLLALSLFLSKTNNPLWIVPPLVCSRTFSEKSLLLSLFLCIEVFPAVLICGLLHDLLLISKLCQHIFNHFPILNLFYWKYFNLFIFSWLDFGWYNFLISGLVPGNKFSRTNSELRLLASFSLNTVQNFQVENEIL